MSEFGGIPVEKIDSVLLADGWHSCGDGTFSIERFEFDGTGSYSDLEVVGPISPGGSQPDALPLGFVFEDDAGRWVYGPLSSVLAVRTKP